MKKLLVALMIVIAGFGVVMSHGVRGIAVAADGTLLIDITADTRQQCRVFASGCIDRCNRLDDACTISDGICVGRYIRCVNRCNGFLQAAFFNTSATSSVAAPGLVRPGPALLLGVSSLCALPPALIDSLLFHCSPVDELLGLCVTTLE
jgi:hypothetical protein